MEKTFRKHIGSGASLLLGMLLVNRWWNIYKSRTGYLRDNLPLDPYGSIRQSNSIIHGKGSLSTKKEAQSIEGLLCLHFPSNKSDLIQTSLFLGTRFWFDSSRACFPGMVQITDRGHTESFLQSHATVCNEACPVLGGRDLVPRGGLFYVVLVAL